MFETTHPTQLFETTQLFGADYLVRVCWNNSSAGLQGRALFSGDAAPPPHPGNETVSQKSLKSWVQMRFETI